MATAARFLASLSLAAIVLVTIAGCTQRPGFSGGDGSSPASAATPPASVADPAAAADAPSRAQGVVIAQLVTHDAKIGILSGGNRRAGDKDLRVVVRRMDGVVVADGITLTELRVRQPDLYEVVTAAFASADGSHGYLDATFHVGSKH